jgi:hypothetical protein
MSVNVFYEEKCVKEFRKFIENQKREKILVYELCSPWGRPSQKILPFTIKNPSNPQAITQGQHK